MESDNLEKLSHQSNWVSKCYGTAVVRMNPGRFAPDPVRPLDVSPQRRFAPGRFAPGRFAPPSRFAPGRFAPRRKKQPILLKCMRIVSANILTVLYASCNVV